jgi:hypothetical protein
MLRAFMLMLGGLAALQSSSAMPLRAPRTFLQLPPLFQEQLVAEGCGIPESGFSSRVSANVIQGQFAASGQTDWAVLCTKRGRTSIRVFWGGPVNTCPSQFGANANDTHMVIDGRDGPYYGRVITTASPARIREAHGRYGAELAGKLPSNLTHDGIEDGSEKGGSISFCDNGMWLELPGSN